MANTGAPKNNNKTTALAKRFEEGVSIINAPKDEDGKRKITKERFLEVLTYDLEGINDDADYTPAEIDYIKKYISKASAGTGASLALTCNGQEGCPFAHRCPWAQINKEPRGKACPLETILFTEFLVRYIEELKVDPTNMMELAYCNELAETEILIMRANKSLAKPENAEMVFMQESISKSGDVVSQATVSPYLEARDRLVKRRERIIKLMVGDRQEKYKEAAALRVKNTGDETVKQSKQRALIMEAQLNKIQSLDASSENTKESTHLTPDDLVASISEE